MDIGVGNRIMDKRNTTLLAQTTPSIVSVCGNIAPLSERGETDREGGKEKKRPPAALQHFTDSELLAEIQRRGYEAYRWLADDWHDEATGWWQ